MFAACTSISINHLIYIMCCYCKLLLVVAKINKVYTNMHAERRRPTINVPKKRKTKHTTKFARNTCSSGKQVKCNY